MSQVRHDSCWTVVRDSGAKIMNKNWVYVPDELRQTNKIVVWHGMIGLVIETQSLLHKWYERYSSKQAMSFFCSPMKNGNSSLTLKFLNRRDSHLSIQSTVWSMVLGKFPPGQIPPDSSPPDSSTTRQFHHWKKTTRTLPPGEFPPDHFNIDGHSKLLISFSHPLLH